MSQAIELRKQLTPASFDETTKRVGGGELGWLDQGDRKKFIKDLRERIKYGN